MTAGEKLGHYEIIAPLGAGGMGEVYRAKDPRLNREVAIKLLPPSGDKTRFQTEAKALAALNHPNIVAIFDVGDNYLVTELIDGAPMKASGVRHAIDLAAQAADGLSAAHSVGIFHRDIKPQNVLVTPEGRVKLIDFGLAKDAMHGDGAQTLTAAGTVMGTAPYMSPEQVRGQKLDARSDLFSLGAVLYEQLAAKRPFQGETVAQTMSAVIEKEPADLPETVPAGLKQIVYRCLAKDKAARFQNAADLSFALRALGSGSMTGHMHTMVAAPAPKSQRVWQGAAAALAVIAAVALWAPWRTAPEQPPTARLVVESPGELGNSNNAGAAISPDGKMLAFVAVAEGRPILFVRALDSLEARLLGGTLGAQRPFWSPDSKTIGYFTNDKLMRIDLAGGAPQPICTASTGRGGTWNRDGVILFATGGIGGSVLRRVSASGSDPVAITEFDKSRNEDAHYYPQFLPDGKRFLYFRRTTDRSRSGVYLGRIDDPDKGRKDKLVVNSLHRALYAPAPGGRRGHLLTLRGESLFGQPFDPDNGEFAGEPAMIAENVFHIAANSFFDVSVSDTGTLTYTIGGEVKRLLTWRDRAGKQWGEPMEFTESSGLLLSPDTKKVVSVRQDAQVGNSLWVTDLERETTSRLMFDAPALFSVWSPDSQRIAFASRNTIYVMPADGSAKAEKIFDAGAAPRPDSWSADGRFLIFTMRSEQTDNDIWVLPLTGQEKERKPFPSVQGKLSDFSGLLSPDGKWLAYGSGETGRAEVYIQGFPEPKGKWMVSTQGGFPYGWRSDNKELIYRSNEGTMMSVSIQASERGIVAGQPVELFRNAGINTNVAGDAKRFLTLDAPGGDVRRPIVVLMNWQR